MKAVVAVLMATALLAASVAHASVDEGADRADADADADADAEHASDSNDSTELVTARGTKVVELGASAVHGEHVYEFARVVGGSLPVVVEFYLPSCGHCQGFAPEYERVARAFDDVPVVVARIDANRWSEISDHYHVSSVPDIRYFPAGSAHSTVYRRPRVATDLVGFINEYAGTKVVFDYSFKQRLSGEAAAAVVDEGTCPVGAGAASFLEVADEAEADVELDAESQDYEGELDVAESEDEVVEQTLDADAMESAGETEADDEAEADAEVDDAHAEEEAAAAGVYAEDEQVLLDAADEDQADEEEATADADVEITADQ